MPAVSSSSPIPILASESRSPERLLITKTLRSGLIISTPTVRRHTRWIYEFNKEVRLARAESSHSADRCLRGTSRAQFSAAGCFRSYRGKSSPFVWPSLATNAPLHTILNRLSGSTFCCRCAIGIVSPFNLICGELRPSSGFLIVPPKFPNHRDGGCDGADKRESDREYWQHGDFARAISSTKTVNAEV